MADPFNIGISALTSAQRQISTVSHNIANVNTDGYSRQRTDLNSIAGQSGGSIFLGAGVQVSDISRIADQFLISQLRTANTNEARASQFTDFANRVDDMLGDGTFTSSLEGFFAAVHDANTNPSSISAREVMLSSATFFADRFADLDQRLTALGRDVNTVINESVNEINSISRSIAEINESIVQALGRSQGSPPNDLLDQRERLIEDLSSLIAVDVVRQDDGAVNLFIGNGQLIVAGSTQIPLSTTVNTLDASRLEVSIGVGGSPSPISNLISNGELGAALDFRNDILDPARNEIGRIATALALSFNEQHREGFDLNDAFGGDFFAIGAPIVNADPANSGSVSVVFDTADPASLTAADYRLTHDGTQFTLTNIADGTTQTLTGAGPFNVDGLVISVGAAPAAGDTYLLQPTRTAARSMSVLLNDPRGIALARPNRTSVGAANIGSGGISDAQVLNISDPGLLTPTTLVFNDPPTTFQVGGVGPLIPYTSGADIDINGWRVQIDGGPEAGDTFTVGPNFGAAGDNGNGLLLADLQLSKIIDGATSTYQDTFGQLVGSVGSKTAQSQISRDALAVLRERAQASRDSLSAVNLDEEAANLLRFQQAYSAAAEVIAIANENFDSLIGAVRG